MKKIQNNCFLIPCNSIIFQKWNSAFLTISKFYIIEFVLNVVAVFFSMYKSKSVKKKKNHISIESVEFFCSKKSKIV